MQPGQLEGRAGPGRKKERTRSSWISLDLEQNLPRPRDHTISSIAKATHPQMPQQVRAAGRRVRRRTDPFCSLFMSSRLTSSPKCSRAACSTSSAEASFRICKSAFCSPKVAVTSITVPAKNHVAHVQAQGGKNW